MTTDAYIKANNRAIEVIAEIMQREGGFSSHPHDAGGATRFGVTEAVARATGYRGAMRDLPKDSAQRILLRRYYFDPKFNRLDPLSPAISGELTDTGINMGPLTACIYLQRALNAFNQQGSRYRDLNIDGKVGNKTISALSAYLKYRGTAGEKVILKALNILQGADYIAFSQSGDKKNESFVYGWLKNRVSL
ncbi:MAG: glycoside hydrolase family 108 protein [Candidatus Reddybacter sp.]